MALDDSMINSIAAETEDVQQERVRLTHKHSSLEVAWSALRNLNQSRALDINECGIQSPVASEGDETYSDGFENRDNGEDFNKDGSKQQVGDPGFQTITNYFQQPGCGPYTTTQTLAPDQIVASDEGNFLIRSLGPISASVPDKQTKKSKKKNKAMLHAQGEQEGSRGQW
ncbi:hypothetical protein LTR64_002185 [Lithohypha guttulata]|uniref:uncharacterized protein n=1 Tax=Lithohypha guttulata TaxID=1690604 RepID=UPI00315C80FD